MINKTILAAVGVASLSFVLFLWTPVISVPPETEEDEQDVYAGAQDCPPMMGGPQDDPTMVDEPAMMDEPGGGHPGTMDKPQRGLMF